MFWPGLRRRTLLSSRSLLLGCRPFLLRSLLMLRWQRLLLYRALLLGYRAFLQRRLLMLRCRLVLRCQLVLRCRLVLRQRLLLNRAFLWGWMYLLRRSLLWSWAHLLRWPLWLGLLHMLGWRSLYGWPRLRNLLGDARPRYRSCSLTRLQGRMIDRSRQWMLLYNRRLDRFTPLDGKRPVHYNRLRLTRIDAGKLGAVSAGG